MSHDLSAQQELPVTTAYTADNPQLGCNIFTKIIFAKWGGVTNAPA